MVALNFEKAPDDGAVTGDFQPAPEGQYNLVCVGLTQETSKAGNPQLVLTCQVEGKPGSLWHYFSVGHPTPSTKNRAIDEFDNFSRAMGFSERIGDTEQAIGKRFSAWLEIEPAQGNYKAKNRIARFLPVPAQQTPPPTALGQPTPNPDNQPAWG